MRFLSLLTLAIAGSLAACSKDHDPGQAVCGDGSHSATVVHGRNMCDANGWVLQLDGGKTYPPDALPPAFEQVGLRVCVTYTLYEDARYCACCGGTRLTIQHIQQQ